uniref:GON-4-like protein n=1 Tax=Denticeps clupeoides TaxID=299321 RepID=A0AAY4C9W4_9TELE
VQPDQDECAEENEQNPNPASPSIHSEEDTELGLVITLDEDKCGEQKQMRRGKKLTDQSDCGKDEGNSESDVQEETDEDIRKLDRDLERKSRQHNLTSVNVRNILHEVITNEHVVAMMKTAIIETQGMPMFEPKMTRSKLKEVVEKGVGIPNWNISPIKKSKELKPPQFVDIPLEEDEDTSDEEYCPDEDEEDETAEDTFLESDVESTASSPRLSKCKLPSSSKSAQRPKLSRHLRVEAVPMGPPPPPKSSGPARPSRVPDSSFMEKLHAVDEELALSPICIPEHYQANTSLVACRTRSKRPLRDIPLGMLEAELHAPDITPDMYDCGSAIEDKDWTEWLQGLMLSDAENEEEADDDDDPEYNFLEDLDEPDLEDYRTDRAVRITKKEVNELMEELFETFQDELGVKEQHEEVHYEEKVPAPAVPKFNVPQAIRYITASPNTCYLTCFFLFCKKYFIIGRLCVFVIVECLSFCFSTVRNYPLLPPKVAWLFATCPVFLYPELLPHCSLDPALHPSHTKNVYTKGEDCLIVLGLKHFNETEAPYRLICQYLLCGKKQDHVRTHVRDMCAVRAPDNVIKFYFQHNLVPPMPVTCVAVKPGEESPPVEREETVMPNWLRVKTAALPGGSQFILLHTTLKSSPDGALTNGDSMPVVTDSSVLKPLDSQQQIAQLVCEEPSLGDTDLPEVGEDMEKLLQGIERWREQEPQTKGDVEEEMWVEGEGGCFGGPLLTLSESSQSPVSSLDNHADALERLIEEKGDEKYLTEGRKMSGLLGLSGGTEDYKNSAGGDGGHSGSTGGGEGEEHENGQGGSGEKDQNGEREHNSEHGGDGGQQGGDKTGGERDGDGEKDGDGERERQGEDEEEEEDFDDLTQDEDEEEVMSSASEESVLSVPELQETMEKLTWLASERRLLSQNSQEDNSEEEEEGTVKGDDLEPGEGDANKLPGGETPQEDGPPQSNGKGVGRRGRPPPRSLTRSRRQERCSKDASKLLLLYDDRILDNDPMRESKDMAFAQAYLNRVREALQDVPGKVEEFLSLLYDFDQNSEGHSAVELFFQLKPVLRDWPELLRDFAAFLLPDQALECGLFEEQQAFERSRRFLRQLEISFGENPSHYQKIVRALQGSPGLSPLKAQMASLLKGHTHLQGEFSVFFDELRPPPARPGQFEQVTWPDEGGASGGFEEVMLPDLEEEDELHKIPPIPTRNKKRKKLDQSVGQGGPVWDGGEGDPPPNREDREEEEVYEEEEEWKGGDGEHNASPKKANKNEEGSAKSPPTVVGDHTPPARTSPPSDTPVCARNISLTPSGEKVILWTREADRVILTKCQQQGACPETFQAISSQLGNKTASEVSRRFRDLMRLFHTSAARHTGSEDENTEHLSATDDEQD